MLNHRLRVFLSIVAITFAHSKQDAETETKIVGGTEVPPGKYKFMAGLRVDKNYKNWCGGSLIDPTHVLTAAHCLYKDQIDPKDVFKYVSVGNRYNSGNKEGYLIRVKSAIIHPLYNPPSFDFAIIELEKAVDDIVPVKLANAAKYEEAGLITTVAGWGALSEDGPWESKVMLEANVPIVDQEFCKASIAAVPDWPVSPDMICAGGIGSNKDTCYGDSGGPLFIMENDIPIIIGITSWGAECDHPTTPGVYARVSAGLDFILEHSSASVVNDVAVNDEASTSPAKTKHWWW